VFIQDAHCAEILLQLSVHELTAAVRAHAEDRVAALAFKHGYNVREH
jgi:tryptophan 2,3-dioxygenase